MKLGVKESNINYYNDVKVNCLNKIISDEDMRKFKRETVLVMDKIHTNYYEEGYGELLNKNIIPFPPNRAWNIKTKFYNIDCWCSYFNKFDDIEYISDNKVPVFIKFRDGDSGEYYVNSYQVSSEQTFGKPNPPSLISSVCLVRKDIKLQNISENIDKYTEKRDIIFIISFFECEVFGVSGYESSEVTIKIGK